jgi:hypothetical protein
MHTLEFAATTNNLELAASTAKALHGTLYCDQRQEWQHLPFRALLTCVTDNPAQLEAVSEVGLYLICRRLIKPGDAAAVGLFPLVRRPDLSHADADAHWRDVHAPLALEHHAHMTHYTQLSVLHRFSGAAVDGFALCGFSSTSDLRERFYTRDESRSIIGADVRNFADTQNSPRRLIATQASF